MFITSNKQEHLSWWKTLHVIFNRNLCFSCFQRMPRRNGATFTFYKPPQCWEVWVNPVQMVLRWWYLNIENHRCLLFCIVFALFILIQWCDWFNPNKSLNLKSKLPGIMLRKWKKDKQGLWNIMWAYWTFSFDCDYRCPENPITSLTIVFSVYWTVFSIYFKYSHNLFILETFIFMHLADAFIQSLSQSLGIEPTTFALLTQCSTTEPQELMTTMNTETMTWTRSHFVLALYIVFVFQRRSGTATGNSSLINCLFEDERGCVLIWNQKELLNLQDLLMKAMLKHFLWNELIDLSVIKL